MVSTSCKTCLLATFAITCCILPITLSLSIPPTPKTKVVQIKNSGEEITTTQDSNDSKGVDDLILEETTDSSGTDNANQNGNLSGAKKPVLEMVDIVFQPFRPPSIFVVDFFKKPNSTTSAESSGTSSSEQDGNSKSSEVSSERFKGTSLPSIFAGSNRNNNIGTSKDSRRDHGGINVESDGRDNNDFSTASRAQDGNRTPFHKTVIGTVAQNGPRSQMTSSSLDEQKQFSTDNEDIDDDAKKMLDKQNNPADAGNDDEESSSPLWTDDAATTTTSRPSRRNGNRGIGSASNNNQRRKRETHQIGDISKEDHDDDSSSSSSTKLTGKSQPDDMAKSNNGDNVSSSNGLDKSTKRTFASDTASIDDGSDSDEDDGHSDTTVGPKNGAVKVFLEILQLIPLSIKSNSTALTSTSSNNNNDDEDSSYALIPTTTTSTSADDNENTGGAAATVFQSLKANSNQKNSSPDTLTVGVASERKETPEKTHKVVATRKRVARSATAKPAESEKKGNPSTSPTTSASPSSRTTSKPLTGKDAPAAHSPSANVSPAKKATSTAPDDSEGPPLENVTEPVGESDDDD